MNIRSVDTFGRQTEALEKFQIFCYKSFSIINKSFVVFSIFIKSQKIIEDTNTRPFLIFNGIFEQAVKVLTSRKL